MKDLPDYEPPNVQRASLAAALAPMIVLLVFTALVARLIDVTVAFAWFGGCTIWVVHEMWTYQSELNRYDAEYERRHLCWRSEQTLRELAAQHDVSLPTRTHVLAFVARRAAERRSRGLT